MARHRRVVQRRRGRLPGRRRSLKVAALATVLLLTASLGVLVDVRNIGNRVATTNAYAAGAIDRRFGKPPSPAQASFYVNFGDIDPAAWPGDYVRAVTLGTLTEPPGVRGGALMQGVPVSASAASYFERVFTDPDAAARDLAQQVTAQLQA